MHGYIAFYNRDTKEIRAESLYEAKQKAIAHFKPPKSKQHLIAIELVEVDNKSISHTYYN